MGLADASDGLRIGDLPELQIDGKKITFAKTPAMITVRHNLSKTRNKYVTFLSDEGCENLLGYLRYRMAAGDSLDEEAPLVAVERSNRRKGWPNRGPDDQPFLSTPAITGNIRNTIWSVTKIRPYALRAYFDTQLLLAESHGCIANSYREFFMGHKGDMEARYTTNKGRLTEQMHEDMRRTYAQSQAFLSTDPERNSEEGKKEMLLGMWKQQARMYGMDPDEMIRPGTENTGPESTGLGAENTNVPTEPGQPYESKIIGSEEELMSYCSRGWETVCSISGGKFLMHRPRGSPQATIPREG